MKCYKYAVNLSILAVFLTLFLPPTGSRATDMSGAQCWCPDCRGRIRHRKTWVLHGRMSKPASPIRKRQRMVQGPPDPQSPGVDAESSDAGDESMQEEELVKGYEVEDPLGLRDACRARRAAQLAAGSASDLSSESESESEEGGEDGEDIFEPPPQCGRAELSAAEITLLVLDWMCAYKVTDVSASVIYGVLSMVCPQGVNMKTFAQIKNTIKKLDLEHAQRLECCPNDCVVYWDSKNLTGDFLYINAHRSSCPVCNAPRMVQDPKTGEWRAAKVFYYFPIQSYLRSLYARPDLASHLLLDCGERPKVPRSQRSQLTGTYM